MRVNNHSRTNERSPQVTHQWTLLQHTANTVAAQRRNSVSSRSLVRALRAHAHSTEFNVHWPPTEATIVHGDLHRRSL